ncbi:MAG: HPr(Ser) kinase/phosphatase [Fusobacteriaceae bacterium]|nr:HPr(Ser) kinase/phosphatase [Fusobacteriaceae bacterium]MBP6467976.1 HPr(Ser) kinase/phosphatase [Fusobacteriaceae bacterium]MBP9597228.1 HPr(Ser) kinase/phosphatase [Fusobacteriaceae bacterium]MBU9917294.1 HPr(Ser) kinase/phosphatase [Fusobacteriaceae bacterium]
MEKVVSVEMIVEAFDLEIVNDGINFEKEIVLSAVHKPGAELTGFIIDDIHEIDNSIHVLGKEEVKYINALSYERMHENMKTYFKHNFPCIVISNEIEISQNFLDLAHKYNKPVLKTSLPVDNFIRELRKFLQKELAPEIVINRYIFLEIFGMGVLLSGYRSAVIGTTIELIEKGHRFVTGEMLTIKKTSEDVLMGENAYNDDSQQNNYFLKVGNEEKINIVEYFGIGATRNSKQINLIVNLEKWNEKKFYDRLGIDEENQYLLGVEIPKLNIPVRKGRNLAIILETAAMNIRMKQNGQNPAIYFLEATKKLIQANRRKKIGDNKMGFIKGLSIRELKDKFKLDVISGEEKLSEKYIFNSTLHRPSLEFSGFYEVLQEGGNKKLQIISQSEFKYLERMEESKRKEIISKYMEYEFPAIVIVDNQTAPDYFVELAKEKGHILLKSSKKLSNLFVDLTEYLEIFFAPTITLHGVMVEVYGFGVLLKGKSGIGKSETALELIHRGHRLIADDMVKLTRFPDGRLVGKAEKVPYFMEIRGLGIIDIKTLYGLGSIREAKKIDLVIELKEMIEDDYMTKADYSEGSISIMDQKIRKVDLYVSSGRNAASMVEIATMRLRAKKLGYDSENEYERRIYNFENKSIDAASYMADMDGLIENSD